jgi:hypothetical protein
MSEQQRAPERPPPSERDPFGTRHSLANLAMVVFASQQELEAAAGENAPSSLMLAHQAVRVVALGFLFAGDALGSLVAEARQIREHVAAIRVNTTRRPPKQSKPSGP